jgi:hypothetical protein
MTGRLRPIDGAEPLAALTRGTTIGLTPERWALRDGRMA